LILSQRLAVQPQGAFQREVLVQDPGHPGLAGLDIAFDTAVDGCSICCGSMAGMELGGELVMVCRNVFVIDRLDPLIQKSFHWLG